MLPRVAALLKEMGFTFNMDSIAYEGTDGTVVDFAPCPPPPQYPQILGESYVHVPARDVRRADQGDHRLLRG